MNSLNAPVLTIVLSVKILHGSEDTSWSQEIHLKAERHCQEQTMSHNKARVATKMTRRKSHIKTLDRQRECVVVFVSW